MGKISAENGKTGEDIARDHLVSLGYRVIQRNFRGGRGEIDIICRKKGITYFVEVKARTAGGLVTAAECITPDKRKRMKSAVMAWLAKRGKLDTPCSFLLVFIELPNEGDRPKIEVIEDYI